MALPLTRIEKWGEVGLGKIRSSVGDVLSYLRPHVEVHAAVRWKRFKAEEGIKPQFGWAVLRQHLRMGDLPRWWV